MLEGDSQIDITSMIIPTEKIHFNTMLNIDIN